MGLDNPTFIPGMPINNSVIGGIAPAAITGTTVRANTAFNINGSAGITTSVVIPVVGTLTITGGIITGFA